MRYHGWEAGHPLSTARSSAETDPGLLDLCGLEALRPVCGLGSREPHMGWSS